MDTVFVHLLTSFKLAILIIFLLSSKEKEPCEEITKQGEGKW